MLTKQSVLALIVMIVPSTAVAPNPCYVLLETCDDCGGTGSETVCEEFYATTDTGGQLWGTGAVGPKFCKTYAAGSHTTTPCSAPSPAGWTRTGCEDNGLCCDVDPAGMTGTVTTGTITRPNGKPCPVLGI